MDWYKEPDYIKQSDFSTVTLHKVPFQYQQLISSEILKSNRNIDVLLTEIVNGMLLRLTEYIWTEDLDSYDFTFPETWWDAFKDRWFPSKLKKIYPIKYKKISLRLKAVYPRLPLAYPKEQYVMKVALNDGKYNPFR